MSESSTPPKEISIYCSSCGRECVIAPSSLGDIHCPRCGMPVWFRVQQDSGPVVIDLLPHMDLETADIAVVGRAFIRLGVPPCLVLNFSLLRYVGSTFLGHLLALMKSVRAANGRMVLCGLNPVIREIFAVTRLDRFFEFADGTEDATCQS